MDEVVTAKARNSGVNLLSYRARSVEELKKGLLKKGYPHDVCDRVVAEMIYSKLLDDRKYALDFASMRRDRGFGRIKVSSELVDRGVERNLVDQAIDEIFTADDEYKTAVALIQRRLKNDPTLDQKAYRKHSNFLRNRGFKTDTILKAMESLT